MSVALLVSVLSQGALWSILALGVFLSYRVLGVADLSVEGTFPLGAAVSVSMISLGYSPWITVLVATLAGLAAGLVTGLLHTKFKIPSLLAGILVMSGLYSVNLRVMGKANISLLGEPTVFSFLQSLGIQRSIAVLIVAVVVVIVLVLLLYWFFGTELGMAIRSSGFNPQMVRSLGFDTEKFILLGLALSNALVAISGALMAQNNGYADSGMGIGTIVTGLAAVIIGQVIFGQTSFKLSLVSVLVGAAIYRAIIAFVLELGMHPSDLKLITSIVVAAAMIIPEIRKGRIPNPLKRGVR